MKKNIWMASALICALAVATVSCNNEELAGTPPDGKGQRTTITANTPQNGADTRVSYDETTNPQKVKLAWETSDAIGVWQAGQTTVNEFTAAQAGASAEFSGNATFTEGTQYYAVYPKPQSVAAGNVVTFDLSAPQAGSMNKAIHYMYASATGMAGNTANFSFTHAVSVLKLSLNFSGVADAPTTLTKVTLSATGLHNKATLTMNGTPSIAGTDAGKITAEGSFAVSAPVYLYIFPEALSGIKIAATDGTNTYEGTLSDNTAVAGKVYTATVAMTVANYIEVNGIKVAVGNLVADGANSAKIGAPTDGGLLFQFGSLVGWSSSNPLAMIVSPSGYTGGSSWNAELIADPTKENVAKGIGDPCKYYLQGTWRTPTWDEFVTLFNDDTGYPSSGPWQWDATTPLAFHTSGLKLSVSNSRDYDSSLLDTRGCYWSTTKLSDISAACLLFRSDGMFKGEASCPSGIPVRCIRD